MTGIINLCSHIKWTERESKEGVVPHYIINWFEAMDYIINWPEVTDCTGELFHV